MANEEPRSWDATFWDIGGVVLDMDSVTAAHGRFVAEIVSKHDVEMDPEEALSAFREVLGDHFRSRNGKEFRSAKDGYAKAANEIADTSLEPDEWYSQYERICRETYRPSPSLVETVETLAASDVHVGIVSDIDDAEATFILDAFGIRDYFDAITTSEECGVTKPHDEMFQTALDKADVPPEHSLMIGDRYDHDIAGAAAHGIGTVAYGANDGEAVTYRVDDLSEILRIVGVV